MTYANPKETQMTKTDQLLAEIKIANVPLSEIKYDEEFNCRGAITPMDVVDLAKDIQQQGLIQPIIVAPLDAEENGKKYLLIAGHRRYMAFRVNKSDRIPAIIRTDIGDEAARRIFNLSENLNRKALNVTQEAGAITKLFNLGLTEDKIAHRLGVSRGWVQVRTMVLKLPPLVQEEIAAGWLNQTQIRDVYSHYMNGGIDACYSVVKEFKDDKLKGRKGTRKKVIKKIHQDLKVKKVRSREEMFQLQNYCFEQFNRNTIISRVLAWAAGEIHSEALHESIEAFAEEQGVDYSCPSEEGD